MAHPEAPLLAPLERARRGLATAGALGLGLLLLGLSTGCGGQLDAAQLGQIAFAANLHRVGRVALVVDPVLGDGPAAAAERWRAEGFQVDVVPPGGAVPEAAGRVVVGTPSDPGVAALLERIGVERDAGRWRLLDRRVPATEARLVATFEDPERPGLPLTLLVAGTRDLLVHALPALRPGARPQVWMWQGAQALFTARLTNSGRPRGGTLRDLAPLTATADYPRRDGVPEGWQVRSHPEVSDDSLTAYLGHLVAARARVEKWYDLTAPSRSVVFAEAHADGCLEPGRTLDRLAWRVPGPAVLAWLGGGGMHDGGAAQVEELLLSGLGAPRRGWLVEAAALEASDRFWSMPLETWCARLAGGELPGYDELVALDACARRSPLRVLPLRAFLVRVARETAGPAAVRSAWSEAEPLRPFEAAWRAELARLGEAFGERPRRRTARPLDGPYFQGRLAEDDPPLASAGDTATLDALAAYPAVALEVHTSPPAPPSTGIAVAGAPTLRLAEGEAAVVHWLRRARERGVTPILVLQQWAAAGGIPAGDRVLRGAEGWAEFYAERVSTIDHVALVAELAGAGVLVLSVGQTEAAHTAPTEQIAADRDLAIHDARRDGWNEWIRVARAAFDGELTLSAARPVRFARFDVWEALDYPAVRLSDGLADEASRALPPDDLLGRRAEVSLRAAERLCPGDDPGTGLLAPFEAGPHWRALGSPSATRLLRAWGTGLAARRAEGAGWRGVLLDMGPVPLASDSRSALGPLRELLGPR